MMAEDLAQMQMRLFLEKVCRGLGKELKEKMPDNVGFMLMLSNFGAEGNLAYVSTFEREGAIKLAQEWLEVQGESDGWDAAARFLEECAKRLGCKADPDVVLNLIAELTKQ